MGKFFFGILLAALTSWMLSPVFSLIEVPDDATKLERTKVCLLNNSIKSNSAIYNIVTLSIESLMIETIRGGSFFSAPTNCTTGLSEVEVQELYRSDEQKAVLHNTSKLNKIFMTR